MREKMLSVGRPADPLGSIQGSVHQSHRIRSTEEHGVTVTVADMPNCKRFGLLGQGQAGLGNPRGEQLIVG